MFNLNIDKKIFFLFFFIFIFCIKLLINQFNKEELNFFSAEKKAFPSVYFENIIFDENSIVSNLRKNNLSNIFIYNFTSILYSECGKYQFKTNSIKDLKIKYRKNISYVNVFNSKIYPIFTKPMEIKNVYKFEFKCYNFKKIIGIFDEEEDKYKIEILYPIFQKKYHTYKFNINNSLIFDAMNANIDINIIYKLINIYSFVVDFQRDLQVNDKVILVTESTEDQDNEKMEEKLLYSNLILSSKPKEFFRFNNEFYDRIGNSILRNLLRTPIDGARISSRFGTRKHPILGYSKMHKGIDFAAPVGTPIYASGDGIIEEAGWSGGYGKMILINHNKNYKTRYAHLSKINVSRGKKIKQKQTIGNVGTTGFSSGPHLHYEVIYNGVAINPASIKPHINKKINIKHKDSFLATIKEIDKILAK